MNVSQKSQEGSTFPPISFSAPWGGQ
uniref:Uncharacterized protein n=1 Tax=Anguilla anguilla TaxID=7936 RepID=A0A0E9UGX5_ANGAN